MNTWITWITWQTMKPPTTEISSYTDKSNIEDENNEDNYSYSTIRSTC